MAWLSLVIWIALAIVVGAIILAFAIKSNSRQRKIDEWYENLPEHKKREHETDADIAANYDKGWGGKGKNT